MAHQDRLKGTHVFVFGGTSGIGFAIANMALSRGARVTISGSGQPKVDDKMEKLRSFYPDMPASKVAGFACDLSDKDNLEANLKAVLDKATAQGSNKIDHVAYTAGGRHTFPRVGDFTVQATLEPMYMRLIVPAIIAKLISGGAYMPLSDDSSFTVTGGTNTYKPSAGWTTIAAAGASLDGLVRGLANDLKPLRINCVIPGAIHTELLERHLERLGEDAVDKMKKIASLNQTFGRPEDIAEAYGYLMRDRFATGSFLTSDGGRLLVRGDVT
jgi:NAD(P)-dependent dehydrogenase (short-subunit alcohol dehydrogenase family)